jgi:hypothetical protein
MTYILKCEQTLSIVTYERPNVLCWFNSHIGFVEVIKA